MNAIVQIKPRWRITIPKHVRETLGIHEGEYLEAEINGRSLVLRPLSTGRTTGRPLPAAALKNLAGVVSIGGDAIEDTRTLYE